MEGSESQVVCPKQRNLVVLTMVSHVTNAVLVDEHCVSRQEKVWPLLENGQVFAPNL